MKRKRDRERKGECIDIGMKRELFKMIKREKSSCHINLLNWHDSRISIACVQPADAKESIQYQCCICITHKHKENEYYAKGVSQCVNL